MKVLLLRLFGLACAVTLTCRLHAQVTTRVSVDSGGVPGNGHSSRSSVSFDGRYVAFESDARNLVPGDTNGDSDIFVHDRMTGQTSRVSVDSFGNQVYDLSVDPQISSDGRYVAFTSRSGALVPGDTNGVDDVFVHDRITGETTRVSVDSNGVQGNKQSTYPAISSDGRHIAFQSWASNLVTAATATGDDVFVHDRVTGQTVLVSVDSMGVAGNHISQYAVISGDGRYVAYSSRASNLVLGDTNGVMDVFVHDLVTAKTTRISVDSRGFQADGDSYIGALSMDGRIAAFASKASNLVAGDSNDRYDIFIHDRKTGSTSVISVDSRGATGNGDSYSPSMSATGRYIAYHSYASNLVFLDGNGHIDVFVHDRLTGQTNLASVGSGGTSGNASSFAGDISADGRCVAFESWARNLVPADYGGWSDIFVHERAGIELTRSGSCPGAITLLITNATPHRPVGLLHGTAGMFLGPGPPCDGIVLGITKPRPGRLLVADALGSASVTASAPAAACGLTIQAVDLASCQPSNTIVL